MTGLVDGGPVALIHPTRPAGFSLHHESWRKRRRRPGKQNRPRCRSLAFLDHRPRCAVKAQRLECLEFGLAGDAFGQDLQADAVGDA